MSNLTSIIVYTLLISAVSLVGALTYAVNAQKLERAMLWLIAFSAGTMIGGAFLHTLPEAVKLLEPNRVFGITLAAFSVFFVIEKFFHSQHHHRGGYHAHEFGILNLIGDSIHNFIDGLIIAAAFLVEPKLGFITALVVGLHEIPQEIGDFAILLYSGFSKTKALIANFSAALTVVFGGAVGYWLSNTIETVVPQLLPVAAGGFLYLGATGLLPELKKETRFKKSLSYFLVFCLGIILTWILTFAES